MKKKALVRFVCVLVSFLLGLGAAEVIVRQLHLAPEIRRMRVDVEKTAYRLSSNPILSYEFKENYRDSSPDLWQTFPYTNAGGQRDIERKIKKSPDVYRIAVLGDSVVCGDGLSDLNDTLSRQLEGQFADNKHSIEVLNFGVSGYCTRSEIELLKTKALAYSPDLVIVVFVENDYENHNGFNPFAFPRPHLINELFVHSALMRTVALNLNLFHFGDQMDPSSVVRWHGDAIGPDNVATGLKLLSDLSQQHGFKTLVVLWPSFRKDGIGYNGSGKFLPVEQFCKTFGISSYRMDVSFVDDWKRRHSGPTRPADLYSIGDEMHPSKEGNRVAAQIIKRILTERYL